MASFQAGDTLEVADAWTRTTHKPRDLGPGLYFRTSVINTWHDETPRSSGKDGSEESHMKTEWCAACTGWPGRRKPGTKGNSHFNASLHVLEGGPSPRNWMRILPDGLNLLELILTVESCFPITNHRPGTVKYWSVGFTHGIDAFGRSPGFLNLLLLARWQTNSAIDAKQLRIRRRRTSNRTGTSSSCLLGFHPLPSINYLLYMSHPQNQLMAAEKSSYKYTRRALNIANASEPATDS